MMDDQREFDPYHEWLEIPPEDQPPTHYRLLGLDDFEEDLEAIDAASKKRTAYLHQIASGPNRKAVQKLLSEVATARRTLLSESAKSNYDERLREPVEEEEVESAPLFQVDDGSQSGTRGNARPSQRNAARSPNAKSTGRKKSWLDDWRIHAVSAGCLLAVAITAVIISRLRDTDRAAAPANSMESAARANQMQTAAKPAGRSLISPSQAAALKPIPNVSKPVKKTVQPEKSKPDATSNPPAERSLITDKQPEKKQGRRTLAPVADAKPTEDPSSVFAQLDITPEAQPKKKTGNTAKKAVNLSLAKEWLSGVMPVEEFSDGFEKRFTIKEEFKDQFSIADKKLRIKPRKGELQVATLTSQSIRLKPDETVAIRSNIRKGLPGSARVGLVLGDVRLRLESTSKGVLVAVGEDKLGEFVPPKGAQVRFAVIMDPERPGSFNWIISAGNKNLSGCAMASALKGKSEIPVAILFSAPSKNVSGGLWVDQLRKGVLSNPPDLKRPMEIQLAS